MKYKELKNKPKTELEKMLRENKEKLRELRFKIANRSLKNLMETKNTKKLIARILTLLSSAK